jgi:hypothetical protein
MTKRKVVDDKSLSDAEPEALNAPTPGGGPDPDEDLGVGEGWKEEKDEVAQYKLLTADAVIDGVKYSQHFEDNGGHYGIFKLSGDRADALLGQGIQLVELESDDRAK